MFSRRIKGLGVLLLLMCSVSLRAEITHAKKPVVFPPGAPFTELVVVDNTIYLAGMVAVKPGTMELVEGDIDVEARQVLDNIKLVLAASGFTLDNLVKCTAMLDDISQWGAFNEVYKQFFTPPYPARSALGTDGLALGAKVEVECIGAVKT